MKTLRLLLATGLLVAALAGCGDRYQQNDLELITAYRARTLCTCLFVSGMDEDWCAAYSVQNPPVATYTADLDRQVVQSQAALLWGDRARLVSERFGCLSD